MSDREEGVFVYLLIDNGLLQESSASYSEKDVKDRPGWLEPIYSERAIEVSPFLVDLEAAYVAGDLDQVMSYLNARRPALHVSIIETDLAIQQISQHLRRFIFVLNPEGKQLTLRYADCAVLAPLASLLTEAQWTTMRRPIERWGIHDRSGAIAQLPPAGSDTECQTPLYLDREKLAALDEASEPDHFIAKVRMMRHGEDLPGSALEQYVWAKGARQLWKATPDLNPLFLLFLTEAVLFTHGEVLRRKEIADVLLMDEVNAFQEKLQEIACQIQIANRSP